MIVVENKIDEELTPVQLKKYNRIDAIRKCQKVCFVKHYKAVSAVQDGWDIRYWGDLFVHLVPLSGTDSVIDDFLAILKEYNMVRAHKITKAMLKNLARALHQVRFEDEPKMSYNTAAFETLSVLKMFLEDLFRKAAEHETLNKRARKKFRPSMSISYWFEGDKPKGRKWLRIGCEAKLTKPHKGIQSFAAALIFYGTPEKYDLVAYATKAQSAYWCEPVYYYPKKDVVCGEFSDKAIKYWAKLLK
jgi:hypothetical protein